MPSPATARSSIPANIAPGVIATFNHPKLGPQSVIIEKIGEKIQKNGQRGTVINVCSTTTNMGWAIPSAMASALTYDAKATADLPRKGDFVMIKAEALKSDKPVTGMITRVGKGHYTISTAGDTVYNKVILSSFTKTEAPELYNEEDPAVDPMAGWSVKGYKASRRFSEETEAYTAHIQFKGKTVLHAGNSGTGGPDCIGKHAQASTDMNSEFHDSATKWAETFSPEKKPFEPASDWIVYQVHYRPYGLTPRQFFEQQNAMLDSFSRKD